MKLNLNDIEEFIKKNKIKQVLNSKLPDTGGYVEGSLWATSIFGHVGSKNRKEMFGYIDLKKKFIHPLVYEILKTSTVEISKILSNKYFYVVDDVEKVYVESPTGKTGLDFLTSTLHEVDVRKMVKSNKKESAEFIENNKNNILVSKWLVIPAGLRDIDIFKKDSGRSKSEINDLYSNLIYYSDNLKDDDIMSNMFTVKIQSVLKQITEWFKNNNLKGKTGILRGKMLTKSTDYSTRLILTSSPSIPIGYIGLPYHTSIAIFEPYFINYIYNKDKTVLDEIMLYVKKQTIDINEVKLFIQEELRDFSDNIKGSLKDKLVSVIKDIVSNKDRVVVTKRDPVDKRSNWFAANVMITEGKVAVYNGIYETTVGGDNDGDAVQICPLFTKEAVEEAKKTMHPLHSKTMFVDTRNYNGCIYKLTLDSLSTIYGATKD